MLIFNEGVPGSGKSYDAVAEHLLPALQAGRPCYVRLNGVKPDRIADYLKLPLEDVQRCLHLVESKDVVPLFRADRDESGEWVLPEKFRNALIIIDECHEFYVASKQPLDAPVEEGQEPPPNIEQFFAMHRHYGVDVLLISQFYKRMHVALRYRVERKVTFQKLTALKAKGSFIATYWQTLAPDRYEKAGTRTRKYKPEIFSLYTGLKDGASSEVYDSGTVSVWRQFLIPALIVIPAAIWGVWKLGSFFTGGVDIGQGTAKPKPATVEMVPYVEGQVLQPKPEPAAPAQLAKPAAPSLTGATAAPVGAVARVIEGEASADAPKLTAEQEYIFSLGEKGRPRLAAVLLQDSYRMAMVEWRDSSNNVAELLTTRQIQSFGIRVTWTGYGLRLDAPGRSIVVTSWPVQGPIRDQEVRTYDTSQGEGRVSGFSPPVAALGAVAGSGSTPRIGSNFTGVGAAVSGLRE